MAKQFLMPDMLDPDIMDLELYHAVVGPALQVAAEVAAKRGDPTLHADMPAMLALMDLIHQLGEHYVAEYPDKQVSDKQLAEAPIAACSMVLKEAGMPAESMPDCIYGLEAGYKKIVDTQILAEIRPQVAKAWRHLADGRREKAHSGLYMATMFIVAAIDHWLEQTYGDDFPLK